jgi:biopolymer transport protein ExbD
MRQIVLYVVAAMIMFVIGVAANNTMDALGDLAIAKLDDAKPLADLTATTLLAQYPQPVLAGANYCGSLIVSVANDRSLYLNQEETGTLNDTAPLTARLRIIFERRDLHAYRPGLELTSAVPQYQRIEKTVFIKAPRWISYGEIADLIRVVKAAGADGIGLAADRMPQPND